MIVADSRRLGPVSVWACFAAGRVGHVGAARALLLRGFAAAESSFLSSL